MRYTDINRRCPARPAIALVTGASRGIGRAVALELAQRGAHVVALARTQGALEELDDAIRKQGGEATLVPCDIKDFDALDRLGAAIYGRWGKLDILVANAGMLGPLTPIAHCDPDKWDRVFGQCHRQLPAVALARPAVARIRRRAGGLRVFGRAQKARTCAFWGPYAASKAALEAMVRTYAAETRKFLQREGDVVNPGPLRTKMRAAAMPGEDPATLKHAGGIRAESRRAVRAGLEGNRQVLRLPDGSGAEFSASRVRGASLRRQARLRRTRAPRGPARPAPPRFAGLLLACVKAQAAITATAALPWPAPASRRA